MIRMTSTEVEKLIQEALTAAGLWQEVDQHKSQFLEFPDGLFTEIVLNDGSKLVDAERVVRDVEASLRKQGTELSVIVRSIWTVQSVEEPRYFGDPAKAAWPATLVSGGLTTRVEVNVTLGAIQEIRRHSGASGKPQDETAAVREVVREFLKLQLSLGGVSRWDPLQDREQELNEAALLYLLDHSTVGKK